MRLCASDPLGRRQRLDPAAYKAPAISRKRGDILRLSLVEYIRWRDELVEAFAWCAKFLTQQHVFRAKDLPYRSQLVPLAVLRVDLDSRVAMR
jgi:hypothetical protein